MTTLAEIEKAIEQLSAEEYAKLLMWMKDNPPSLVVTISDEEFQAAAQEVFDHYAPLLEKLAK